MLLEASRIGSVYALRWITGRRAVPGFDPLHDCERNRTAAEEHYGLTLT